MNKIFFGVLLVFFKTNVSFLEIGAAYYVTNSIGYLLIFFGVKELGNKVERVLKAQPYVVFMVIHSIIFLLLNTSGNSPLTIAMDSYMAVISFVGLCFVIAGMFMIFVIISLLIEGMEDEFHTKRLSILCVAMMMIFTLAGLFYFFTPGLAQLLMSVLLFLKVLFLIVFYHVYLRNSVRNVGQEGS
ncbi:hypothetical protein [Jeotgalibacillus campisalis]|uniref:Uncharacterized protein n=1 Tax=Jeotgalibacillus campisalis TaxID=220754 RepID=A0A0C2VQC5_9BACL|nr:hypothetical protein [Jeotgalibacillus campisalis]KIL51102.1 hypothetical protein KR50_09830 [Jeotgalibacillus campisalis]